MSGGARRFTERQRQIVRLIAEGLTAREIGEREPFHSRRRPRTLQIRIGSQ